MTTESDRETIDREVKSFEDRLSILKECLTSLVTEVSTSKLDRPAPVYISGSLGRRIAMSEAKTWEAYCKSITENPKLAPRKSHRGLWDCDIAVPAESIPWLTLASISREISLRNDQQVVEIDPHYIDINAGSEAIRRGNTLIVSVNNFIFGIETFDFAVKDDLPAIKVPDMWSQLLFYLSSRKIRPRDIPEIKMLAEGIIRQGKLSDKSRIDEAIKMVKGNKELFSLNNLARWPYWIAVPYPLRVKIARLRHVRNADIRGYDKTNPVYL